MQNYLFLVSAGLGIVGRYDGLAEEGWYEGFQFGRVYWGTTSVSWIYNVVDGGGIEMLTEEGAE